MMMDSSYRDIANCKSSLSIQAKRWEDFYFKSGQILLFDHLHDCSNILGITHTRPPYNYKYIGRSCIYANGERVIR